MPSNEAPDLVMVVDDSPDTLKMLTDALSEANMTVLVALEGAQALSMVEKIMPDIILLDALMPGMDGFETCRRLKRNKSLWHVPIIFMTGLTETEDIVKAFDAGGVDYVTKPIVPDELLARIRVHLANARMAQSARAALDAAGRFLLAVNTSGRLLWSTPQAGKYLGLAFKGFDSESYLLPANVQSWLKLRVDDANGSHPDSVAVEADQTSMRLSFTYVGRIGSGEILLRLVEGAFGGDEHILERKLSLTRRESEVLTWIARGKSNRDIADILKLSPRTVNKHLEQIYAKLGVENRASAAALAVRTLGQ